MHHFPGKKSNYNVVCKALYFTDKMLVIIVRLKRIYEYIVVFINSFTFSLLLISLHVRNISATIGSRSWCFCGKLLHCWLVTIKHGEKSE